MKKIVPVLCMILLWVSGCGRPDEPAVRVGPVSVSSAEFQEAFQRSRYAHMEKDGRTMFLNHYIDTKLLLLEAERMGLDKDPEFLEDVQQFWEQALLKRLAAEKNQEFAHKAFVTKDEIRQYYEQHKDSDFQGKSFQEAQSRAGWILLKIKQNREFSQWLDALQEDADITINHALLGIKQ